MTILLTALGWVAGALAVWVLGSLAFLGLWIVLVEIGGHLGDEVDE